MGFGEIAKLAGVVIGLFAVLKFIDAMTDFLAVFNEGITVAASGGNISPYITATILILVAFLIPGWLFMLADAEL